MINKLQSEGEKMKLNKNNSLLLVAFLYIFLVNMYSAWISEMPVKFTQPDGTEIEVFRSGDEFHNWVHDAQGMTILKDEKTGFWCYGKTENGDLVSTGYPIHLYTAEDLNITPFQNISQERYNEKRAGWEVPSNLREYTRTPTMGIVNNLVIFIRFADDPEFTAPASLYDALFNNAGENVNSLYQYYWDASYQQLEAISHYYPIPIGNLIVSYQALNYRAYYSPYHELNNPIGYMGGSNGEERAIREHALLQEAVLAVQDQIPTTLVIDADNDGFVDNVCFMIRGSNDDWAELLWPHRWVLYYFQVYIHNKRVYDYNFNLEDFTNSRGVGVLAHEFGHSLSAPDYYRYTGSGYNPIAGWDLMASDSNPPQSMSAHTKHKYMGWIAEIPLITEEGTYTLNPLSSHAEGSAYKIVPPIFYNGEYFIVEYRSKNASYIDYNLPGTGLLIYRVDDSLGGNAQGPPDELYVYRPNGTLTADGQPGLAYYSAQAGRIAINNTTNPSPFFSNGDFSNLNIANIGTAGETISFEFSNQAISIYPMQHDFGNTLLEETTVNQSFQISNLDLNTLIVSEILLSSENEEDFILTIEDLPWNIEMLGHRAFNLIFSPNSIGNKTAEIVIIHNYNESPAIIPISGNGQIPSIFHINPTSHNFGYLPIGEVSPPVDFTITNTAGDGAATLIVNNITRMGPSRLEFTLIAEGLPWFIEMGEQRTFSVVFEPRFLGIKSAYLRIFHDTEGTPFDIPLEASTVSTQEDLPDIVSTMLHGNYPNPFNPETIINFSLAVESNLQIDIYNSKGQKIISLIDDFLPKGEHSIAWSGKDQYENKVGSGLYFYRMKTEGYTAVKKMILMK